MTDNNTIGFTPFCADLTSSLAHRGERLLASTNLTEEVAKLSPLEAYYIVRDIGLDQSLPILLELNQEQVEACIDLDCWNRYDFTEDSLDEWLTAFSLAGPEALAKAFLSLSNVIQLLFLAKTVTVYDPDTDQIPEKETGKGSLRAMTPDGFYLLELKTKMVLNIHPFTLLDALYQHDLLATHQLLSEVRVDLSTQIEEEALHFRNGRMQDIGFVTPDEASRLFSRPVLRKPLSRPRRERDRVPTRVPSIYTEPLNETTLLQQALFLIADQECLFRIEQEIVSAINSAIIVYGERTKDTRQINAIAERVRDTICLGMESLLSKLEPSCPLDSVEAVSKASDLLEDRYINDLFQHGFASTLKLQQEVQQALHGSRFRAWYNLADINRSDEPRDRLEHAFVVALLGRHPLQSGFDPAKAEAVKAFSCLADIELAHLRLKRLVAQLSG